MKKLVLIPLDERPCNVMYPQMMFNDDDVQLVLPGRAMLGDKKKPADFDALAAFLLREAADADGVVVSIDMLVYGGIVPSRLHHTAEHVLKTRFDVLRQLRLNHPNLTIYAFDLVMRCPQYNSSDEEPDYYDTHGRAIFETGYLGHRMELELATPEERSRYATLSVPRPDLADYLHRRAVNLALNLETVHLVDTGVIDFLVVPQDDAARHGYTAKDQALIQSAVDRAGLSDRVLVYPGADEVANTLLARHLCRLHGLNPSFFIDYPAPGSAQTIPLLEDRPLDETVRLQINAAGGRTVESLEEADIALFVNASATLMAKSSVIGLPRDAGLTVLRDMTSFIKRMKTVIEDHHKPVVVADVATLNGADHELIDRMQDAGLLMQLAGYAGWNTSSNTLGTAIPMGITYFKRGVNRMHQACLCSRYVEDYAYMSHVRSETTLALKSLGVVNGHIDPHDERVTAFIKDGLERFMKTYLPSIAVACTIEDVWLPWRRLFEIGLTIHLKP